MLNNNITTITPPRVPLLDPATGLISREWYRFFFNIFTKVDGSTATLEDLQKIPVGADISSVDALNKYIQSVQLSDTTSALISEFANIRAELQALQSSPVFTPQLHRKAYGSFYDTTNQTAAAINTAYAMTFNSIDYSLGVTLGTLTSEVYVDRPGLYNIQFSAQLDKTAGAIGYMWIWLDKNGSSVANSATQVSLQGASSATVAAWNFLLELNAGDYFRLMWSTDDTNCYLKHDAAVAPVPAIPSVILTVTNNINDNMPY